MPNRYRIEKHWRAGRFDWWVYLGDDAVRVFQLKKYAIAWILAQEAQEAK
jgi:hypothetical protein